MVAANVGAFGDLPGGIVVAPIKTSPDFEHLEAKGHDKTDARLRKLKEDQGR
jgi:hypothetical protein